jgi:hypothetical protein
MRRFVIATAALAIGAGIAATAACADAGVPGFLQPEGTNQFAPKCAIFQFDTNKPVVITGEGPKNQIYGISTEYSNFRSVYDAINAALDSGQSIGFSYGSADCGPYHSVGGMSKGALR